jgi:hypothetical protein
LKTDGEEYEIQVANTQTGQKYETLHLSSHTPQHCMCEMFFSADGNTLITVDPEKVTLWYLPPSRPWLHILGWPLLPVGVWFLWRWRVVRREPKRRVSI